MAQENSNMDSRMKNLFFFRKRIDCERGMWYYIQVAQREDLE